MATTKVRKNTVNDFMRNVLVETAQGKNMDMDILHMEFKTLHRVEQLHDFYRCAISNAIFSLHDAMRYEFTPSAEKEVYEKIGAWYMQKEELVIESILFNRLTQETGEDWHRGRFLTNGTRFAFATDPVSMNRLARDKYFPISSKHAFMAHNAEITIY